MDYRPNYYSNRNAVDKSNRYKKKRIFWLNSSFNSDFVLIDNKIYEISWDIPPFEIYKNNRLKLLTYIRDSHQSKPIQIKLKLPLTQSRDIINTDKEAFPIIYTNHTGVEMMTYGSNPIIRLIPQQITRFTFRLDDNFNQLDYNYYFTSITNGSVFQVAGGSPDDKYIIFNSSGSFVLDKNLNCDILAVGGGGGGANGGGGAGGFVYLTNQNLNSGTYTVQVGAGGAGVINYNVSGVTYLRGNDGQDSHIMLGSTYIIRAFKGGGGAEFTAAASTPNGTVGSGGGNGMEYGANQLSLDNPVTDLSGGNKGGRTGLPVTGQFYYKSGGGGGGAGGIGGDGIPGSEALANSGGLGGAGGIGLQCAITGINTYYAGGGGGGTNINNTTNSQKIPPQGGLGGGGNGSLVHQAAGTSGTANTGGGGGGSDVETSVKSGDGGSGIVIIRFKEIRNEGITAEENLIQATNNSITVNTNSKYQINYQNPVNIPKGTYQSIFANGAITFKSKPDYNYPILNTNPSNWYKFDTNSLLIDNGSSAINLTSVNVAPTADTNIFTRGDSSALFVRNTTTPNYLTSIVNLTTPFTISFWFNINNANNNSPFGIGADNLSPAINCTYDSSTNKIMTYLATPNLWNTTLTSTATININTWYHYTLIVSNTNPVVCSLYINGVLDTSGSGVGAFSTNNKNLRIGIRGDLSAVDCFGGYIDDFRIYKSVLSPVEVYDLYNGNTDRSYPILKDANNTTINPFVWYQFDTSTNLGSDSMGIHNLTNPNGVAFSNDYIKGNGSASFDGVNDHLIKDSAFNLNSKSWSISVWFKKTANSRNDWLFELGTGLSAGTTLTCGYRNTNVIGISNYNNYLNTAATYNDAGNWVHLCFTFLTGTKQATIYRNGVQVAQMNFTIELNTNNNFRIGKLDTLYCQGLMDDFRIYESVLTATQVSELYNGRLSIYNPPAFLTGFELEDEDLFKENTISSYK